MYFDETAWVAVAFIIFIALIWKKASNAIVSILDNRSLLIHNELNEAKSLKEEALEELRRSADLTQQDLSISAEVSRKSINAIENGVYVPSTVLALKIAKTLDCKVEDLFKLP